MLKKMLGRRAEDIAARFLKRKGLKIIERNFSCRFGEIDIMAKDGDGLVVVEVRSGNGYSFHDPLESITYTKRKRLQRLALVWLNYRRLQGAMLRFDVVIIVFKEESKIGVVSRYIFKNRGVEIRHIKDAF